MGCKAHTCTTPHVWPSFLFWRLLLELLLHHLHHPLCLFSLSRLSLWRPPDGARRHRSSSSWRPHHSRTRMRWTLGQLIILLLSYSYKCTLNWMSVAFGGVHMWCHHVYEQTRGRHSVHPVWQLLTSLLVYSWTFSTWTSSADILLCEASTSICQSSSESFCRSASSAAVWYKFKHKDAVWLIFKVLFRLIFTQRPCKHEVYGSWTDLHLLMKELQFVTWAGQHWISVRSMSEVMAVSRETDLWREDCCFCSFGVTERIWEIRRERKLPSFIFYQWVALEASA